MANVLFDKEEKEKMKNDVYEEIIRVIPMWFSKVSLIFGILSMLFLLLGDSVTIFSPLAIICSVYTFDTKSKPDHVYAGIGFLFGILSYVIILAF